MKKKAKKKPKRRAPAPDRGNGTLKCRICGKPYTEHRIGACEDMVRY